MIEKPNPVVQAAINRAPNGVKRYITQLENAVQPYAEESARQRKEIERLEKINRILRDRCEAMVQMFQCAAKGGSEIAAAVQRIVEDFLTDDSLGRDES